MEIERLESVLPAVDNRHTYCAYGAWDVARRYCGVSQTAPIPDCHWQHGWVPMHRAISPQSLFGSTRLMDPTSRYWVAREDQARYLQANGFKNARAIGLPIVYTQPRETNRLENSLLVMPIHSHEFTQHRWNCQDFVDAIVAVRDDFALIVACVHPSCARNGYWLSEFSSANIPVIQGAAGSDANALVRTGTLMSSFEYVVSNGYGSHLAYAAHYGAKVSISTVYQERSVSDQKNDLFYEVNPHLKRKSIESTSKPRLRMIYPFLFCEHPKQAKESRDWGGSEVGAENRLSPTELKKAFGWTFPRRTVSTTYSITGRLAQEWLPESVKRPLRKKLYPQTAFREDVEHEATRLSRLPPYESGSTTILGPALRFPSGPSCAYQLKSIFGQEVYKFKTLNQKPRIIDGGANLGIASIYFARHFPEAQILAFEPDPQIFDYLTDNLRSFQVTNVEVHQAALWTDENGVSFAPEGGDAGKVVSESATGTQRVTTVRLRDLLDEPVDFLKLDVEGSEVDLLTDCADRLHNVERLFVEYHSQFGKPQRLQEVVSLLSEAGFRLHVIAPLSAAIPFMHRPVRFGFDMLLEIFAFR